MRSPIFNNHGVTTLPTVLQPPKISHHSHQRNKSVCHHPNTTVITWVSVETSKQLSRTQTQINENSGTTVHKHSRLQTNESSRNMPASTHLSNYRFTPKNNYRQAHRIKQLQAKHMQIQQAHANQVHHNNQSPWLWRREELCELITENTIILFITMHGILLTYMPICFTVFYVLLYFPV